MVTPWLEYRTANQYLEHVSKNKISLNYPAFVRHPLPAQFLTLIAAIDRAYRHGYRSSPFS